MAIALGGIELPDLVIENEFGFTGVQSVVESALDGTPNIWEAPASGKPIDLVGGSDTAWITRATLIDLHALASVPGVSYSLSYEGTDYAVRFRNEEPPAIEATPLLPRPNPDDTDYYHSIRIKLMEI